MREFVIWGAYAPGSEYAFVEAQDGLTESHKERLLEGERLGDPLPRVTVTRLSNGKLGDVIGATTWGPLVATPVREELSLCCAEQVQLIDVAIRGRPQAQYAIANVLAKLPLIDLAQSSLRAYDKAPHAIYQVKHLVLKPIPDDAPPVFRLAALPDVLLVAKEVREQLEAASESPGVFTPVEKFTYGVV